MIDIWSNINQAGIALGHWLYPPDCALCGASADDIELCAGCLRELPWNRIACGFCALPLLAGSNNLVPCARCQQSAPVVDDAWSALVYDDRIRWLHRQFKFGRRLGHCRLLSQLLAQSLTLAIESGCIDPPDRVVVMPLHRYRLGLRGFNQSLELMRPAARRLGLMIDYSSLQRIKATAAQSTTPADRRRQNVRGVFACPSSLAGAHVALFDDVVTTGETMSEAARVLRRAGAARISAWSLARTAAD